MGVLYGSATSSVECSKIQELTNPEKVNNNRIPQNSLKTGGISRSVFNIFEGQYFIYSGWQLVIH